MTDADAISMIADYYNNSYQYKTIQIKRNRQKSFGNYCKYCN